MAFLEEDSWYFHAFVGNVEFSFLEQHSKIQESFLQALYCT